MKKVKLFGIFIVFCSLISAQQMSLKDQSIEQFKKENYPLAIELMQKASAGTPDDPEVYYYLGFFNHYNAYDSRPLQGYDSTFSDKILAYLDKALSLRPNYGDAKYFYLAECGAGATNEYQAGNLSKVDYYLDKAYNRGAIPEWMVELCENMLNSCEDNSILFTHGDVSFDVCLFLQLHFGYRKDITLVPLAMLDRPSFTLTLSNNESSNVIRGLNIGLTKAQILDMHPYKWDTVTVKLPVPASLLKQYSLPDDYKMNWVIEPDLISNRTVSKIEGETVRKRTYLSPARAIFLSIIEANKWERPVYFTNTFETYFLAGLDKNFQNCGLVSKLLPLKTDHGQWEINVPTLEKLVLNTRLVKLKSIIDNDQPRVSGIAGLYANSYYFLAEYYRLVGKKDKISQVIDSYKKNLMIGFKPGYENEMLTMIKKMQN